ncbi:hypothetical protein [Rickettsiella endosymbiont of Dermanyssus gallinae]|uniref:hypothetical protein n=1 Tax=Rickettsiella endosymbiont of Dermanyssus gallinae TaxID=2856608 RepID=UPI001C531AC6|nr:hypothetical protein [Rickettsiella endosymbiont of Dermanyssus gallinae]
MEDVSNFTIKLGGKNSIDAEAFNNIIQNTVSLMKRSASIAAPDAFLRVEINGNSQGSFLTSLAIIIKDNPTLFHHGKEIIGLGVLILGGFYNYLKIKQHLKGEKEKSINFNVVHNITVIINKDNETLKVDTPSAKKYFENNEIETLVSSIFSEAKKENRTSFELIPSKESKLKPLTIKGSDFDNMAKEIVDNKESITHIVQPPSNANWLIKQPDFIGDSQWVFIYNKTIKASIKDKVFLDKIKSGQIKLGANYYLHCSFQLEYDLINMNEAKKDSEKYTVLEVFEVIEPKQKELF